VETDASSKAGLLDWWVTERQEWWVAYAVQTAGNGGSELLIFVPSAAHSPD
jgi:predicted cobalt transporter CbtA